MEAPVLKEDVVKAWDAVFAEYRVWDLKEVAASGWALADELADRFGRPRSSIKDWMKRNIPRAKTTMLRVRGTDGVARLRRVYKMPSK